MPKPNHFKWASECCYTCISYKEIRKEAKLWNKEKVRIMYGSKCLLHDFEFSNRYDEHEKYKCDDYIRRK